MLFAGVTIALIGAAFLYGGRYTVRGGGKSVIIVDRFTGTARYCSRASGCKKLEEPADFSSQASPIR